MAFVGYVVLWNVSLQLNSVGFYQLMKARPARSSAKTYCMMCKCTES